MSTDLRTFPRLGEVILTAAVALEMWAIGPTWLQVAYRVLVAWWLSTFAYAAIRNRLTCKEPTR